MHNARACYLADAIDVLSILNAASKSGIFFGLLLASCAMALQAQTMSAVVAGQLAITEQQAIALFYQRNLGLIAANLNIDNARAQEIIAGAIPNPVLSFTAQERAHQCGAAQLLQPHTGTKNNQGCKRQSRTLS